jgi:hypothetical protein
MAADAGVEVDDQAELAVGGLGRVVIGRSGSSPIGDGLAGAGAGCFAPTTGKDQGCGPVPTGDAWARRGLFDLHPQVEPGRLAGDRVGIGPAQPVALGRQQLVDQVVEQEALGGLGRVLGQRPGALALADGVPGPDRVFVERGHARDRHLDLAMGEVTRPSRRRQARSPPRAWWAHRAGCRRGSAAARRSASPRNDTSPSGAGSARGAGRPRPRRRPRTADTRPAAGRSCLDPVAQVLGRLAVAMALRRRSWNLRIGST